LSQHQHNIQWHIQPQPFVGNPRKKWKQNDDISNDTVNPSAQQFI